MAGVKLPTYTDLGGPAQGDVPEAPTTVVKYDPSAPFTAAAEQGADATKDINDYQDIQSKMQQNVATASLWDKHSQILQSLKEDPNIQPADIPSLYAQRMNDATNQIASTIGVPQAKSEWQASEPAIVSRYTRQSVYDIANNKEKDIGVNATDTLLQNTHNTLSTLDPTDPATEVQDSVMGEAVSKQLDLAAQKGWITPQQAYQKALDFKTGVAETRYQYMANQDVNKAYTAYQANKADLPVDVQLKLDAWFKPQVRQAGVDSYINSIPSQLSQIVGGTSGSGVSANNLGNVKTAEGAANNTPDFINPATPMDGVILAANNLRKNYQGLTLQQIGAKWTGEPDKTDSWVKAASQSSGIAPDAVPNLNDPTQLQAVVKGMNIAENSSAKAANFTDDVINKGVQASLSGQQASTIAPANNPMPTSAYQTQADLMAANRPALIENAKQWAKTNYPNDPTMERTVIQNVDNYISSNTQAQAANYIQDNRKVMQAISGDMTKGVPPTSVQDLRAIPGMSDVINRVAVQDSKFYDDIPNKVAQMASRNTTTNSPNGFDTIMRSTDPIDPATMGPSPNSIDSQDKLNSLLGKNDGNGINIKDYNDAKPLMEADQKWKDYVHQNMQTIANTNGNVDGQGQGRAMQWYQNAMQGYKSASTQPNFDVQDYVQKLTDANAPPQQENWISSRMDQISNMAKSIWNRTSSQSEEQIPTFKDPNDPAFVKLPSGASFINGVTGKKVTKK